MRIDFCKDIEFIEKGQNSLRLELLLQIFITNALISILARERSFIVKSQYKNIFLHRICSK